MAGGRAQDGPAGDSAGDRSRAGGGRKPPGGAGKRTDPKRTDPKRTDPKRTDPKRTGTARSAAGQPGRREEPEELAAQLAAPLHKVLARLPETQRRVLELRMGLKDGHPHDAADTARALGMSVGEVREVEARAFERIREVIPLQQLARFLER
jgi:DNA-directed RNA polymerase specialized sigma24 family protein